jgi:hypothetical protein
MRRPLIENGVGVTVDDLPTLIFTTEDRRHP